MTKPSKSPAALQSVTSAYKYSSTSESERYVHANPIRSSIEIFTDLMIGRYFSIELPGEGFKLSTATRLVSLLAV